MASCRFPSRIPGMAVVATIACLLAACESLRETRECLQYEQVPYHHQVCETRSNTGFCTYYRSETRYRTVCKRYGPPKPKSTASAATSSAKIAAAGAGRKAKLEQEARERNSNPYGRFKEKLKLADEHYPPRSFNSCRELEGVWYARCERIEKGECVQASRTQGLCTEHFMPGVEKEEACQARKAGGKCVEGSRTQGKCSGYFVPAVRDINLCDEPGQFRPECARFGVNEAGREYCVINASYGRCTQRVHHLDLQGLHRMTAEGAPHAEPGYR
jgi:hypothetical protein